MPKPHRGVCTEMTCAQVQKIIEKQGKKKNISEACKKVAEELGLPAATVRTIVYREKLVSPETKPPKSRRPKFYHFFRQYIQGDAYDFGIYDKDGKHTIVIKQTQIKDGEKLYTGRIDIEADLIPRLLETIDRALRGPLFDDELQERLSEEAKRGCTAPYFYQKIGIDAVGPPIIVLPKSERKKGQKSEISYEEWLEMQK
ncbi:MAG: hypothetical protein AB1424_08995 [Thermodesulfobacteriota bacterium]